MNYENIYPPCSSSILDREEQVKRVREEIAQELSKGRKQYWSIEDYRKQAELILSNPRIGIIDDDQSRPKLPRGEDPSLYTFKEGQESMERHNFQKLIPVVTQVELKEKE